NITVTAVWKSLADRTRNPAVIGFSQRLVTITDIAFTLLGVVLLAITGPVLAAQAGLLHRNWVILGETLFALTGVVWLGVRIPVQDKQAQLARQFAAGGAIPDQYWRLARMWTVAGSIATLLPLVIVALMVIKPL